MRLDFIPGNFFTQEQILSNINVAISTMCFARMASCISLCSSNFFFYFSLFNAIFKGYFPFTVITKYWLYLPFWAIHPQACFTPHGWCFLLTHPYIALQLSPPPKTTSLLSTSVNLLFCYTFLDSACKWYHAVFSFFLLWLISLSKIPSRFIHVAANGKISFFFMTE